MTKGLNAYTAVLRIKYDKEYWRKVNEGINKVVAALEQ